MLGQKRLRDYGLTIGTYPPGPKNSITDVPGVRVGHVTLNDGPVQTGVTAVLPHPGNLFREKILAAAEATEEAVLNSMICADTTTGRNGHTRHSLREHIDWLLKQA